MTNDTSDKRPANPSGSRTVTRNDFDIQRRKRIFFPSATNEVALRSELANQQILIEEGLAAVHEAYFVERGVLLEQRRAISEESGMEWITVTEWSPGSIAFTQGLDPNFRDSPSPTRIVAMGEVVVLALTIESFTGNAEALRLLAENERRARLAIVRSVILSSEIVARSWRVLQKKVTGSFSGPDSERELIDQVRQEAMNREDLKMELTKAKAEGFNSRRAVYQLHAFCLGEMKRLSATAEDIARLDKALGDALHYTPDSGQFPASEQVTKAAPVVRPTVQEQYMPESHRSGAFANEPGSTQKMPVFTVEELADMAEKERQREQCPPSTEQSSPGSKDIDDLLAQSDRYTTVTSSEGPDANPPSVKTSPPLTRPPIPRERRRTKSKDTGKIGELILDSLVDGLVPELKITSAPPTVRATPESIRPPGPDKKKP